MFINQYWIGKAKGLNALSNLADLFLRMCPRIARPRDKIADKIGVSKAHIWEMEKGRSKNPSFELVRKLADHFGVSIDALVGDAAEPSSSELQLERMHRGFDELTTRDRDIVEEMIKAMKARAGDDS